MRTLRWVVVAVLGLAAVATLDPAILGASTVHPVAQLIALRSWVALEFAALALGVLLLAALVRRVTRHRPPRLLTLALLLALVAAGHGGILAFRGFDAGQVPAAQDAAAGDVTVLSLNILGGAVDPDELRRLVIESGADVVALPESGYDVVAGLAEQLAAAGQEYQAFPGPARISDDRGTGLLVSARLGEYVEVTGAPAGVVRVDSVDGTGPPIAAVHPIAPPGIRTGFSGEGHQLGQWRGELDEATAICRDLPGGIVAGDFNATLDHAPLRDVGAYVDASVEAGMGGLGTFPARLPALLGTTIDHVLVDSGAFTVVEGAIVQVSGTDHRAVIVRLAPRA